MADSELEELYEAVDKFAVKMKLKLRKQYIRGYIGWNHRRCLRGIKLSCLTHVGRMIAEEKNQSVDIANLAMFVHFLEKNNARSTKR